MSTQYDEAKRTEQLLSRLFSAPIHELTVERKRLRGGLEAASVSHVVARFGDRAGRRHVFSFVEKQLSGRAVREASVYALLPRMPEGLAPRLFASEGLAPARPDTPERVVMYMEPVRTARVWPWSDTDTSRRVLERVASLHLVDPRAYAALPAWDYEEELLGSALHTLAALERGRHNPEWRALLGPLAPVRRLVLSLRRLRHELATSTLGTALLHGDLHSGNALIRRRARAEVPVLLDWGRARVGSPLEDVSSWLQSLGYWDHETRRRHDTLFGHYLGTVGRSAKLTTELRESYWLASASNVLAGALAYHLHQLHLSDDASTRARAAHAVRDGLRVLRRAHALWN